MNSPLVEVSGLAPDHIIKRTNVCHLQLHYLGGVGLPAPFWWSVIDCRPCGFTVKTTNLTAVSVYSRMPILCVLIL